MKEKEAISKLKGEGFRDVYVWEDSAGAYYPPHSHEAVSGIVLSGEIKITASGKSRVFGKGERFDVKSGEVHSAKVGKCGCKYIVAENKEKNKEIK